MVGIGTVLNDDPQLNARLLSHPPPVSVLPRPIILDSSLRTPVDSRLIRNYTSGIGRRPLIICSSAASMERRAIMDEAGAEVREVEPRKGGSGLHWLSLLQVLYEVGIKRLMVEGGAAVIDSLMQEQAYIDVLLVTISPVTVGPNGFGFSASLPGTDLGRNSATAWTSTQTDVFGCDKVILWRKGDS
jgi:riboflavin biosynthesis pyrimidine reductase